jgi:putative transposase
MYWYNVRHYHSGIKFMMLEQLHKGDNKKVVVKHRAIYETSINKHSERWRGKTQHWGLPQQVHFNPETNSLEIKQTL